MCGDAVRGAEERTHVCAGPITDARLQHAHPDVSERLQNRGSERRRRGHAHQCGRATTRLFVMTNRSVVNGDASRHRRNMGVRAVVDVLRVVRAGWRIRERYRSALIPVRCSFHYSRLCIAIVYIREQDLERAR